MSTEPEWLTQARAKGLSVKVGRPAFANLPKAKREKVALVEPAFNPPSTWTIPVHVVCGDNIGGGKSRAKIGRAGHERNAVFRVLARQHREFAPFADAAQVGKPVVVRFTRLGRAMDDDGVQAACKYVRDAVAAFLGVGDGPTGPVQWLYSQQASPLAGVRVELSTEGD